MKRLGRILSCAAVVGMLLTPSTFAAETMFTDVESSYWGATFVESAAKAGIVKGYPAGNGKTYQFRPEQAVTKQEAVAMLYNTLKTTGRLKSETDFTADYAELLEKAHIAGWAKPFIAYGLHEGILNMDEVRGFLRPSGVAENSSRQEVATWTAKALGMKVSPVYALPFTDADSIGASYLPYVDLIYREKIMAGNANGTFLPTAGIKRSEFAVICTKLLTFTGDQQTEIAAETGSCAGTVTAIDGGTGTVTLKQGDGTLKKLKFDPNAKTIVNGKVQPNGMKSLPVGSVVSLSWETMTSYLHIQTGASSQRGIVLKTAELKDGVTLLTLADGEQNAVTYYMDSKTQKGQTPKEGDLIMLITDGAYILEME